MINFSMEGYTVSVFPSGQPASPLICLNTFGKEGEQVMTKLREMQSPDFSMVAVSDLDWDHDMAPWDCPPLSPGDTPCTGGADDYLQILTGSILPEAEKYIDGEPVWRGLCGYSLAGLFAVYAIYQTDLFSRIASMSGSLWFPGIKEYIQSHDMKIRPDHIYFSLGDKECRTRNQYLRTVQDNTTRISEFYAASGIDTVFHLNPGNHYADGAGRTAAGIDWILRR